MIKVSVIVPSYNQNEWLKKSIESILMQKVDFEFEIVVIDDHSTDGSVEFLKQYQNKFPELFKVIYHNENYFALKKYSEMFREFMESCSGEYIAFCEGDDYWTDEYKLQKQVNLLDSDYSLSGCFHKSKRINVYTGEFVGYMPSSDLNKTEFTIYDTLNNYFIETVSVMYRLRKYKDELLQIYPTGIVNTDTFLIYFFSIKGKIKYINEVMSVKTINNQGIWNSLKQCADQRNVRFYKEIINFPCAVNQMIHYYGLSEELYCDIGSSYESVLNSCLSLNRRDLVAEIIKKYPNLYGDCLRREICKRLQPVIAENDRKIEKLSNEFLILNNIKKKNEKFIISILILNLLVLFFLFVIR